ncbi:MAG: hypothetical protein H7X99_10825 [Saprospiraceae bacterium]|nr:hypothetical protein [Saprospiraceae bacterium]
MKNLFLLTLFIILNHLLSGQKVDIDNKYITISCAAFPENYVPEKQRTYSLKLDGNYLFRDREKIENFKIYGWAKTEDEANMDILVDIHGFVAGSSYASSRTEEKKDKDGKVISSTKYYKVSVTNRGEGVLKIFGPRNIMPKTPKKEKEKEKEKDKKKKEESANPFLQNVDTRDAASNLDESVSSKGLAYNISLNESYDYTTNERTSPNLASNEFQENYYNQQRNHEKNFHARYPDLIPFHINKYYGYRPTRYNVKFKELDSEKHPEYQTFTNAIKALEVIFSKMRYNKSIEQIATDLSPIINYFESLISKYNKDDKHEKKLKAASYYNLARIFQYLDDHDKVIEIGRAIIASENDEDDGEDFIKESENWKSLLAFHHMKSRHIVPKSASQEEDELGDSEFVSNK